MARNFDEVADYGSITDAADLTLPDGDWTICLKIKIPDNSGTDFQYFFSHGVIFATPSINMFFIEDTQADTPNRDKLRLSIVDSGGDVYTNDVTDTMTSSGTPGTRTDWQYWFFIRSGSTFTMYEENTSVGTDTNALVDAIDPTTSLFLATREDLQAARFYGGDMADIMKVDRALSSNERQAIVNGVNIFALSTDASYQNQFWGNNSPESDFTGNGHTVSLVSAPAKANHPPVELMENYL